MLVVGYLKKLIKHSVHTNYSLITSPIDRKTFYSLLYSMLLAELFKFR